MNLEAILNQIRIESEKYFGIIPYVMIQPRLSSSKEFKIACFNGDPKYAVKVGQCNSGRDRSNFGRFTLDDIKAFARMAISELRKKCPHSITDGLVRVDIMYSSFFDCMFVNEYESLDAVTYSTVFGEEESLKNQLVEYFYDKLIIYFSYYDIFLID